MQANAGVYAIYIGIAICLGALGAHALENKLSADQLDSFKTGVLYHLLIGIVLFFFSFIKELKGEKLFEKLLFYGNILFSFSIYILSCKDILGMANVKLVPVAIATPLGGIMMITAWLILGMKILKKRV
jgi:uncharacterized membrane protein YgdD (TMEM256/DUF423 family)